MMYLWPQSHPTQEIDERMGIFINPSRIYPITRQWALDNGAFAGFDEAQFIKAMQTYKEYKDLCLFVVAPDVVGNARETIERYSRWYDIIKSYGYPVAFVAQDGQEDLEFPEFDWLFIGGSTEWKMGAGARYCIRYAHSIDKPVHVGRVNSWRRYEYFKSLGCRSCDGTHPIYEPDTAYQRILAWIERPHNLSLFGGDSVGEPDDS